MNYKSFLTLFILLLNCASFIHLEFFQFVSFVLEICLHNFFLTLSYFLALRDVSGFHFTSHGISHFPKEVVFLFVCLFVCLLFSFFSEERCL